LIYERDGVGGRHNRGQGIDKNGKHKDNFHPRLRYSRQGTVLAKGRAIADQAACREKNLSNINPQSYGIGIKELWDISRENFSRATSRTRWAGRFPRRCTAAAGSMA